MTLTATDAKNRFGQVLEMAQNQPAFIEKAGRRHGVVMSVEQHDRLVAGCEGRPARKVDVDSPNPAARRFYEQYKDWVDERNRQHEQHGIWNEEFRRW